MTQWVPVFTSAQVRAAERPGLSAAGHPLMLWAARALAMVTFADDLVEPGVSARDGHPQFPCQGGAALAGASSLLAGEGDNGGDALFAAAALLKWMPQRAASAERHRPMTSASMCSAPPESAHAQGLATALAAGSAPRRSRACRRAAHAQDYDLVLDGILGIGTTTGSRAARRRARRWSPPSCRTCAPGGRGAIAARPPDGLRPDEGHDRRRRTCSRHPLR